MIAAIACPGPSLATCGAITADVVIGVNRAATLLRCDWYAAIDYSHVLKFGGDVRGSPKWLTNQSSFDILARQNHPWSWREHVTTDWLRRNYFDTQRPDGVTLPWTLFSFTSALVFAAYLGVTRVEIYGADWQGTQDWDGVESADLDKRSEQRWDGERKLYERVKGWMTNRKVEICRHSLCG